jgi:aldose 1-epimerase
MIEKKKFCHVITLSHITSDNRKKPIIIKIAPELGSNLFSIRYGNDDIIYTDPQTLENRGFTGTYVLFPTPNRVRDFIYTWKNKHYMLQKDGKKVTIHHQLVFDQIFQFLKPVIHERYISFKTYIKIDNKSSLFKGFPFPCTLTLEYRLYSNRIRIIYSVINQGNEELPYGFGLHPHFQRISGNDNTLVNVAANVIMENEGTSMLPNGKLIPVNHTPCDLRSPKPLTDLVLDHVYTNLIARKNACIDYTTIRLRIILSASADFTHIVVYTGHPNAVCIENQTCSTDAHNMWTKGYKKESHLLIVKPKQANTGFIDYEFQPY